MLEPSKGLVFQGFSGSGGEEKIKENELKATEKKVDF